MIKTFFSALAGMAIMLSISGTAIADQSRTFGKVTNRPIPRFVSMKASESNVRRGPSLSHRIDWVFKRRHMPLIITAEHGHWRRVEDSDGMGGWVHYTLLSGNRTVLVEQNRLNLRARAAENAPVTAILEAGVVARVAQCDLTWCQLKSGGYKGWAPKKALWGVRPDEVIN